MLFNIWNSLQIRLVNTISVYANTTSLTTIFTPNIVAPDTGQMYWRYKRRHLPVINIYHTRHG